MKILFLCTPHRTASNEPYQHELIALAEGFKALGISVFSNVNYWKNSVKKGDYLLKAAPTTDINEYDLVLFSSIFKDTPELLPDKLFDRPRNYQLIYIDSDDGLITPGFQKIFKSVDIILKSHYSKKYTYPPNFIPWQFGLSNRIINSVQLQPFPQRNNKVLWNFRCDHHLRRIAANHVMPIVAQHFELDQQTDSFDATNVAPQDILFWQQTGRRHYPAYYERLGKSKLSAAFGGILELPFFDTRKNVLRRVTRHPRVADKIYKIYDRVYQYDSWRFWESLASGCCTLHIDFEKYGILLPENPINGVHYLGADLTNLSKMKNILSDEAKLENIAKNGRKWVFTHYNPLATANRLLNIIGDY